MAPPPTATPVGSGLPSPDTWGQTLRCPGQLWGPFVTGPASAMPPVSGPSLPGTGLRLQPGEDPSFHLSPGERKQTQKLP